ncbi:hypothetical protein Fmac_024815 [Flemingia macrophylla]|uniref:Uncharacterized protein n=1 Tax=Flemingia macrophylla TaxID=520843 RepID=A0ABD1LQF8_9FABA
MTQMLNALEQRPHKGESSRTEMQKNAENLHQRVVICPRAQPWGFSPTLIQNDAETVKRSKMKNRTARTSERKNAVNVLTQKCITARTARRCRFHVLKNPDMDHDVLNLEEDVELRPKHYIGLDTMKDVGEPKQEQAGLKVSKYQELNMVNDVEELKLKKKLELEISEDLDLNKVNNREEQKPQKAVELRVSNVVDLNKVKNVEELKQEKALELKVSKV